MWIRRPRVVSFSLFAASVVMGACASSDVAPSVPPPATVPAFRYSSEVLEERMWVNVPEIWLPEQNVACNVSSEFAPTEAEPLRSTPSALPFDAAAPRNRDRTNHERPLERYELPADLVADLVELVRLRREERELSRRVAERLVPLVPLDFFHEFTCVHSAVEKARALGVDRALLQSVQDRVDRLRDGSITDDRVGRMHAIRQEVERLLQQPH